MISRSSQESPLPHNSTHETESEQANLSPAYKKIQTCQIIMDNIDTLLTTRSSLSEFEKPPGSVGPRRQFTMKSMFRAFCLKHLIEEGTNTGLRERLSETSKYLEICGLPRVPSYATFSRGFAALAEVFGEQAALDEIVADWSTSCATLHQVTASERASP